MGVIIASVKFSRAASFPLAFDQFIPERSLIWEWLSAHWQGILDWLHQPIVVTIISVWLITFTLVIFLLLMVSGFGPHGIIGGSFAAWFQSWMYGGFTPAGGLFAFFTSAAMVGSIVPPFGAIASFIATVVTGLVWLLYRV